jgi:hypothetical protein
MSKTVGLNTVDASKTFNKVTSPEKGRLRNQRRSPIQFGKIFLDLQGIHLKRHKAQDDIYIDSSGNQGSWSFYL